MGWRCWHTCCLLATVLRNFTQHLARVTRGVFDHWETSEVLEPPDPTSVLPSPRSPCVPFTRLQRRKPWCLDLCVLLCLSGSGTGPAMIFWFYWRHLAVSLSTVWAPNPVCIYIWIHMRPVVRFPEIFSIRRGLDQTSGEFRPILLQRFSETFRGFRRSLEIFRDFRVLKPGAKPLREVPLWAIIWRNALANIVGVSCTEWWYCRQFSTTLLSLISACWACQDEN